MEHFIIVALMAGFVIVGIIGYHCGKADNATLEATLVTERAVRHNLNCLVGDLRHEFEEQGIAFKLAVRQCKEYRADALAFNQCKGLWCTDQPDLIKFHPKKERFFRLGYPEHKL